LIKNKLASGRPRDMDDVENLKSIKSIKNKQEKKKSKTEAKGSDKNRGM
jgi:hypothetical protein